jgi:hemolysin activation/secretion protein
LVLCILACAAPARAQLDELPPIPEDPGEGWGGLGAKLRVSGFRFSGNTAIAEPELQGIAAPYANRELYAEDLEELRAQVTKRYFDRGFVTSFATIPPQRAEDGIVEIRIHEGSLGNVAISGTDNLAPEYVRDRLAPGGESVLNVHDLERRLQLLQKGGLVKRIQAQIVPGPDDSRSELEIALVEEKAYSLIASVANDRSPAVGETAADLALERRSLFAAGDRIELGFQSVDGLDDVQAGYSIPLTSSDITLDVFATSDRSEVVEAPFDDIDIESRSTTFGLGVRAPLWRDSSREAWAGIFGELRRSESSVLGERFSFSRAADDGVTRVRTLRFQLDWSRRGIDSALAVRSTLSTGLGVMRASTYPSGLEGSSVPDARFVSWLGQLQWIARLPTLEDSQLVTRADVQLAHDALLPLEQFEVGGSRTVRGYRENSLVRDNGAVVSAELRIPILRGPFGEDRLQLAPFVDLGRAWNETHTPGPKTLASAGLGLRWRATPRLFASLYWGGRFRDLPDESDGLQRAGLHFEVVATPF